MGGTPAPPLAGDVMGARWGVFLFLIFSLETIDKQPIQCIIGTERGHKMAKSREMEHYLDSISMAMFGQKRSTAIADKRCAVCGQLIYNFRNELSRKEYGISGMCQSCQDSVFGVDNEA